MKLAAICDKDTAVGLRLAGIHELFIPSENPIKILYKISERDNVGVVFITEKIAESIIKELKEFRLNNDIPIILEIPDKTGRLVDHIDFVSHLVKRAVGIDISERGR